MTSLYKLKQQYYPLLSAAEHEMEGFMIAFVKNEYDGLYETCVTLVNGTTSSWLDYKEKRLQWEAEGFLAGDGQYHHFPKLFQYNEYYDVPREDMEDGYQTTGLWKRAQKRLERSREPLYINLFDGDTVALNDWATELDLVSLVKRQFPEDKRFQGHFRLMIEVFPEDGLAGPRNISWLNASNWYTVLNGSMPLEVILEYLDEEESVEMNHRLERAQTPLSFNCQQQAGKYTLENWAPKQYYPEDPIYLDKLLQQKYPELEGKTLKLMMSLPDKEEPEDVATMTQEMKEDILDADTALVINLVITS